ncbi:hypothetical protein [Natranaerobius thermophilus]|uniref:Uncharacterized protein n=1 Tax=Natranaerobius thermophilus (strain ATCC BAA-1301 / DSM 18059 / JW/NM-WN-LF) TaxID=457570 RepID=B2A165_NATTJ|nr:hypothetical protein [Natranaerobius thermophilus]ACB86006.1 hypothetical protein Nther_2441 [Natranaerobius thermophilus JW/NM-WN-LF]
MQMLIEGTELEHDTECFINCGCQYEGCDHCYKCSEQCVGEGCGGEYCGGMNTAPWDD